MKLVKYCLLIIVVGFTQQQVHAKGYYIKCQNNVDCFNPEPGVPYTYLLDISDDLYGGCTDAELPIPSTVTWLLPPGVIDDVEILNGGHRKITWKNVIDNPKLNLWYSFINPCPDPAGEYTANIDIQYQCNFNLNFQVTPVGPISLCPGDTETLSANGNYNQYNYQWMKDGEELDGQNGSQLVVSSAGNYSLKLIDPNTQCTETSNNTVNVTMKSKPAPPLIPNQDLPDICEDSDVLLKISNPNNNYIYKWYKEENGEFVYKGSGTEYLATSEGTYRAVAVNQSQCGSNPSASISIIYAPVPDEVVLPANRFMYHTIEGPIENLIPGLEYIYTYTIKDNQDWPPEDCMPVFETVDLYMKGHQSAVFFDNNKIKVVWNDVNAVKYVGLEYQLQDVPPDMCYKDQDKDQLFVKLLPPYECEIYTPPCDIDQPSIISPNNDVAVCNEQYPNGYQLIASPGNMDKYYWYNYGNYMGTTNTSTYYAQSTGSWTVKVKEGNCISDASASRGVTLNANPNAYIEGIWTEKHTCEGEPVVLTAPYSPNYSYKWYHNNGNQPVGTEHTYEVSQLNQSGTYQVEITSINTNCSDDSEIVTVYVHPIPNIQNMQLNPNLLQAEVTKLTASINPVANAAEYLFSWGDGYTTSTIQNNAMHIYQSPGIYTIKIKVTTDKGCEKEETMGEVTVYGPLCEWKIPEGMNGQFMKDKATGLIVWEDNNCNRLYFMPCIKENGQAFEWPEVVSVSASTIYDEWDYTDENFQLQGVQTPNEANNFERAKSGKWRTKESYAYKTEINNDAIPAIAGHFGLELFNWQHGASNNPKKWIKATQVESYSPHGNAIQEHNALNISTSAKFGYNNYFPTVLANNASKDEVYFESFEMLYGQAPNQMLEYSHPYNSDEIDIETSPLLAHSGRNGVQLNNGQEFTLPAFKLSSKTASKGLKVKLWVQVVNEFVGKLPTELYIKLKKGNNYQQKKFYANVVSSVGFWTLVEMYIDDFESIGVGQEYQPVLMYDRIHLYFDDILVKPVDAQVTSFVYDTKTLRLLTQFDDQHFGTYYHYNLEGKLIRKSIETERGKKTVQETHYHVPDKEN